MTAPGMDPLNGAHLGKEYWVVDRIGDGGMGVVYIVEHRGLKKQFAAKILNRELTESTEARARFEIEARSASQLEHENIVNVTDYGVANDGRPFLVMELLRGKTLFLRLTEGSLSLGETAAVIIPVCAALAAAHEAGIVHRDIKPENVLVGVDGRARVGDFGLARELDSKEDALTPSSPSVDELLTPVTQTGAVLGTPAYMSPEQFAGAPVDARADQFAFCVTAWEALWGERPFAGASFAQLHAAIALGTRRPAPTSPKVPIRVRRALERGLSTAPADRFPSLHALLDAMRPRARRYRRGLIATTAVVLAGVTALLVARGREPSCDAAGASELAAIRGDLPALLAQHGASQIALHAMALQQQYTVDFRNHARAACEAGRLREWSPDVIAKSRVCFAIVARTTALTLARLDPSKPMDVLRHLRQLPPQDQCRNQTHLASRPPIPSDPKQLDALIEANATLGVGFESVKDHNFVQLRAALVELEASPARADPGVVAGMTILRGWIAFNHGQITETRRLFVDAYYAGRAIDDEQISSIALCQLIDQSEQLGLDRATVEEWLRTALADADRVRVRSPWLAGQVYVIAARAADFAADAEKALVFVARAREVLPPGTSTWIETLAIEGAVLMWSGRVDEGIKAYDAAVAQKTAYAGPEDPEVAALLSDYAASLLEVQRNDAALRTVERAAKIINNLADPNDDRVDHIRVNLAAVLINANQDDEAYGLLITARANNVRRLGETNAIVANIDSNLAVIYNDRGEYDRAVTSLKSALAIQEKLSGPDHVDVADVLYNLAASYRYKHEFPAALEAIDRAAKIQGARSPGSDRHRTALTMIASIANEAGDYQRALDMTSVVLGFPKPAETPQTPAWAELERATALIALHRGAEARPLLVGARAKYAGLHMTKRTDQIDAMLARLGR